MEPSGPEIPLFDSHCHLIDYFDEEELDTIIKESRETGVIGCIENATCGLNFDKVQEISKRYPGFVYHSYGYHPCYLQNLKDGWFEELDERLEVDQEALIGEIGLDFRKECFEKPVQRAVFKKHLDLAIKHQRTVSVHSVRAQGDILKIFKKYFSKKREDGYVQNIIMHSYGGSKEIALSLLKLKSAEVFFSFCGIRPKTEEVIKAIPMENILIETDSPHQLEESSIIESVLLDHSTPEDFKTNRNKELHDITKLNEPRFVKIKLEKISKILNIEMKELSNTILKNSMRAIRRKI